MFRSESSPSQEKRSILAPTPFSPRTATIINLPECHERRQGKNNIVRVFVNRRPNAGDAFTRTRLVPTFWVLTGLSAEHCGQETGSAS